MPSSRRSSIGLDGARHRSVLGRREDGGRLVERALAQPDVEAGENDDRRADIEPDVGRLEKMSQLATAR